MQGKELRLARGLLMEAASHALPGSRAPACSAPALLLRFTLCCFLVAHLRTQAGNVLLDGELRGALGDLGVARAVAAGSGRSVAGFCCTHAAPEVLMGQRCGVAADMYRCGAGMSAAVWSFLSEPEARCLPASQQACPESRASGRPPSPLHKPCPAAQLWRAARGADHAAAGGPAGRVGAAARGRRLPRGRGGAHRGVPARRPRAPAHGGRGTGAAARAARG